MNRIVCTFDAGNSLTFCTEDRATAIVWFNSLWDMDNIVEIQLLVGGRQVFSKSKYRNAV